MLGGVFCCVGLLLSSVTVSIYQMYLTYSLVFSIGSSFSYMSSMLVLNRYFLKNFVIANGIALSGAGIGTIALSSFLSLLLDNFHWRDAMLILSGSSILLFVSGMLFFLVPTPIKFAGADEPQRKQKLIDFTLLRNKAYCVWIAVVGLILFGYYIPYVHLVGIL